ncbi:MAG: lysine exporter LysO family protein [Rikenellaceae bacterium]
MKGSIIIVSFFAVGLLLGLNFEALAEFCSGNATRYILYVMMLTVGISIGCDKNALKALRSQSWKVILLPLGTIVGTLLGAMALWPTVSSMELKDVLAVASGFGYYSLSSILLTEYRGAEIGTIALLSNVIREIATILAAPLLVRYFGRLSVISSAGATSIDTLLPIITRFSGKEYVIIAIFHGLVMEITVPILVTIFASL